MKIRPKKNKMNTLFDCEEIKISKKIKKEEKFQKFIFFPSTPSTLFFNLETENDFLQTSVFEKRGAAQIQIKNSKFSFLRGISEKEAEILIRTRENKISDKINSIQLPKKIRISKESKKNKKHSQIIERRKKIIELFQKKMRMQQISNILQEKYNFVCDTVSDFRKDGKINEKLIGRQQKIKKENIIFVDNFFKENNNKKILVKDVKNALDQRFSTQNWSFKLNLTAKIIRQAGYTYKRAKTVKSETNLYNTKKERHEKVLKIIQCYSKGIKFIFIDESCVSSGLGSNYGFSLKGKPYLVQQQKRIKMITFLSAISEDGFIGAMFFDGYINAKDFGYFLLNLINNNENIKKNLPQHIFYFDNLNVHHAKTLQRLFGFINIFYGPKYSPQLNPIEDFFGNVKRKLKETNFDRSNPKCIMEEIVNLCHTLTQQTYLSFMVDQCKFCLKALKMEDFPQ